MKSSWTNVNSRSEWATFNSVGEMVRSLREKKNISLRTFASMVEVSPTYVSFLERNLVNTPPTEKLIKKMAHVLGADENEMLAMAGRISTELIWVLSKNPRQMSALLKSAENLPAEEIEELTAEAIRRQAAIKVDKDKQDVQETKRKKQ